MLLNIKYERSVKILFSSIKYSCDVLNKLKSRGFRASSLSTSDFSTVYSICPNNRIKDKLVDLMKELSKREGSLQIACNDRNAFFRSDAVRNYNIPSCQKVCEALTFLVDNFKDVRWCQFSTSAQRKLLTAYRTFFTLRPSP